MTDSSPLMELKVVAKSYQSDLVLDLREGTLVDCRSVHNKFPSRQGEERYPWEIVLLGSNMIARLEGLHRWCDLRSSLRVFSRSAAAIGFPFDPCMRVLLLCFFGVSAVVACASSTCRTTSWC